MTRGKEVQARLSKRADPGETSSHFVRLQKLALGTPDSPRLDGVDLTLTNPEYLGRKSHLSRELAALALPLPYAPEACGPLRAREAIRESFVARGGTHVSVD